MTFVVVFVGLMIERFFDWSHLRVWNWFADFQRWIIKQFQQPSGYVNLAISIVPILLGVWLLNHLCHGWMYGFPSVIFKVFILLYCFGPQNLWADAFACVNAVSQGDNAAASDRLKAAFKTNNAKTPQALHRNLLSDIFIASNRRVFAVVFWFVLLGPVGAMLYRLVVVSSGVQASKFEAVPKLSQPAQSVASVLDWAPIRIITFLFALSGQFMQVTKVWLSKASLGLFSSDDMMTECGMAAMGIEADTVFPDDCKIERAAVGLVDRSLVIVLVVLALVVLV